MSRRPVMLGAQQFIFDDLCVRGFWLTRWMREHAGTEKFHEMWSEVAGLAQRGVISVPFGATTHPFPEGLEAALDTTRGGKKFLLFE